MFFASKGNLFDKKGGMLQKSITFAEGKLKYNKTT